MRPVWLSALLLFVAPLFAAEEDLPLGVRSLLELRQLPADSLSIYVEDIDSGEVVLEWLADEPRNPASTMNATPARKAISSPNGAMRSAANRCHAVVAQIGSSCAADRAVNVGFGGGIPWRSTMRNWNSFLPV